MKEYIKPEIEMVDFASEAITDGETVITSKAGW